MEWQAYDKLDPIGNQRWDLQFAFLNSVITNIAMSMAGKKGSQKFSSAKDFLIDWDPTADTSTPVQSLEDMRNAFAAMAGQKK